MDSVAAALGAAAETGLMPRGGAILLAVSGGADSMALLYGASEPARLFSWRLSVGHVHHGWRGREADRDLSFVREHARRLGIPFLERRREASAEARRLKLSPEAAARHVRYEALSEMAREAGACRIATAHQRNDVAESYLIARERKGGLARLAGPRAHRADGVVRPLLEVGREEILTFLAERGLTYRRDSSNGNLRLPRNRIRREVLAALPEGSRQETLAEIARQAADCRDQRDRIDREFEENLRPRFRRAGDTVVTDAIFLEGCSPELQRRAIAEAALPFALPGRAPLTGKEREQILRRLSEGRDFRFEAGRPWTELDGGGIRRWRKR
jgi:tRNA(Ile)-lysidine synthetase-like protein